MALKNLLSISVLQLVFISFYGCNGQIDNSDVKSNNHKLIFEKDFNTISGSDSIIVDTNKLNNVKRINNDSVFEKKRVNRNYSEDKVIEGEQPKDGTLYILYPFVRINDSISLFEDNYDKFMRKLVKKGIGHTNIPITDPFIRDSILWEKWQKMIKLNDYKHKHVPYNRNMKFGKQE